MKKLMNVVLVLLLVALVPVSAVLAAAAPQKILIGISKIVAHPALDAVEKGIQDELTEAKINATFDLQNANGDISTAASIANKFQSEKVTLRNVLSHFVTDVISLERPWPTQNPAATAPPA